MQEIYIKPHSKSVSYVLRYLDPSSIHFVDHAKGYVIVEGCERDIRNLLSEDADIRVLAERELTMREAMDGLIEMGLIVKKK